MQQRMQWCFFNMEDISFKRIDASPYMCYTFLEIYTCRNDSHGGKAMEGYMTTRDASEMWGISQRQVQIHCKNNHIPGVVRVGTNYLIPEDAKHPIYGYQFFSSEISSDSSIHKSNR